MDSLKRFWILVLVGMSCGSSAHAMEVRPVLKAGADFGGDTLVTVTFTNGTTERVKAHEGAFLGGGVSFLNHSKSFEVETTLAYKFDMINAANGDVTWSRYPLDVLAFYRFSRMRLGGGLTYHMSPKVSGSGAASNIDTRFDNALGAVVEGDYLFSGSESGSGVFLGLRFTSLKYKEKTTGVSVDSNGVGLQVGYRF